MKTSQNYPFAMYSCFRLWELLNAEHSHVAQVAVPLLLHCVTLPYGMDTFWTIVQKDFHNSDWRARFMSGTNMYIIPKLNISSVTNLFLKE